MCIIIDVNTLPLVIKSDDKYTILHDFIFRGRGKLVYGGTKYKQELEKMTTIIRMVNLLKDTGKVCHLNDEYVNMQQKFVEDKMIDSNFNDPHLVAISISCHCTTICTNDKEAIPHLKTANKVLGCKKIKIYQYDEKHKHLLNACKYEL